MLTKQRIAFFETRKKQWFFTDSVPAPQKMGTPVHLWYTRTTPRPPSVHPTQHSNILGQGNQIQLTMLPLGQVTHYLLKFCSSITPG